jgi:hypothetical protein
MADVIFSHGDGRVSKLFALSVALVGGLLCEVVEAGKYCYVFVE